MVAKHDGAQASLMAQLKARRVKKTYLALVQGRVSAAVGRIEAPIGRDPEAPNPDGGRPGGPAVDHRAIGCASGSRPGPSWNSISSPAGPTRSGSTSTRSATPSRGDPVYGTGTSRKGPDGLHRMFLHAWRLELASPSDGHLIRATAELPPELESVLDGPASGGRALSGDGDQPEPLDAVAAGASDAGMRCWSSSRGRVASGRTRSSRRSVSGRMIPDYHYVVTCTTRAARPGEVDGVSYHFMDRRDFLALRDAGGLLEANEVHGNWYGTPRSQVQQALAGGHDVILKIDVQGAQQVKERVADALLIFVVPPSMETLFARLKSRATETVDELELRQRNAAIELARQDDYDYVVTNETGQVERTAARIDEIIAEVHGSPSRAADHPLGRLVTLGLSAEPIDPAPSVRLVEVARGCGRSGRLADLHVPRPARLADLVAGEAVLVAFGRRQALGIIVAETDVRPGAEPKPIVDRVRADGPLLPPLSLALAPGSPRQYLAPPALVLRAMVPPGLLERLELVAELDPGRRRRRGPRTPWTRSRRPAGRWRSTGARPGRPRKAAPACCAACAARRCRGRRRAGLDAGRSVGGGPRFERWLRLTRDGRTAATALGRGERGRRAVRSVRARWPRSAACSRAAAGRARGGRTRGARTGRRPSPD